MKLIGKHIIAQFYQIIIWFVAVLPWSKNEFNLKHKNKSIIPIVITSQLEIFWLVDDFNLLRRLIDLQLVNV